MVELTTESNGFSLHFSLFSYPSFLFSFVPVFLCNLLRPLFLSLSVTVYHCLLPFQITVLPEVQLAAGQTSDKLPHILLNCVEQWQGRHQYVARQPGNPADVTIVLLVSNNNNNRNREKTETERRTVLSQCKSGTFNLNVILTGLDSLWTTPIRFPNTTRTVLYQVYVIFNRLFQNEYFKEATIDLYFAITGFSPSNTI